MSTYSGSFIRFSVIGLVACALLLGGCGKKEGETELVSTIKNTWKKFDVPAGADPSVPDSLGGAGFEVIAEGMGFTTFTPNQADTDLFVYPVTKGGEIRNTISRFPLSFRPFFYGPNANFTENSHMSSLVYENLLGIHPVTLDFVPSLASHWKISDDAMKFTFRIDPDARWADGKRVTAQDVVATFKLIMDESIQSPSLQQSYGRFNVPVALSMYLVEVEVNEKNWRNFMTFSASMQILQADEIGAMTGREFVDRFQFTMPVGSGPYIILPEDINKQQSYSFSRRADWWQAEELLNKSFNNFDKLTFVVVVDNPTLEYEMFKKGEVDYFSYTSLTTDKWLNDVDFPAIKNNWIQRYRVFTDGPAGTWGYYFNTRKPPFDDIRVRKAIAYLLDRKSIISKLLFDEYVPSDSWYGNSMYEFPGNEKVRYDPEKAAQLLAEAGWKTRNADGILTKNGKPFVVELPIIKPLEQFVTPFKETAREAGVEVQIKYVDGNTLSENMMERNFSFTIGNYGGLVFPNPESSLKGDLADKKHTNNVTGFKDPYVDKLIETYRETFDQQERVKIIQTIDSIVCSQRLIALWWAPKGIRVAAWNRFGMPKGILNKTTQVGDQDLPIVTGWWVDPKKDAALREAKKSNTAVEGSNDIIVNKFWKTYKR
jgi:microcin C transport system substrate-binding protein